MAFCSKDDKDSVYIQDIEVPPPFPYLVSLPNLLIDNVQVDFQMEVTATESTTENNNKEASTNSIFKFGCVECGSVNRSIIICLHHGGIQDQLTSNEPKSKKDKRTCEKSY